MLQYNYKRSTYPPCVIINEIYKQILPISLLSKRTCLDNLLVKAATQRNVESKEFRMKKTILITGSTDGIGLETAKELVLLGHKVLLHGRNQEKLELATKAVKEVTEEADLEPYLADLSSLEQTANLAAKVIENNTSIDVVINNAGVYKTNIKETSEGLDFRFTVNTISPYLLTKLLLPILATNGRIVNLSSAAQAPVIASNLARPSLLDDSQVYAQSKLALTMWTTALVKTLKEHQVAVAVNPKSFIGSKMVKEAYGIAGGSLKDGSDILVRAAVSEEFSDASGKYFDNDIGQFSSPHREATNQQNCTRVLEALEVIINK